MERLLVSILLIGVGVAQISSVNAIAGQIASQQAVKVSDAVSHDSPALPQSSKGKSTILGGEIRSVDPVRDQFMLRVFGQRPMKILFDERTEIYLDGKSIPIGSLVPVNQASVQTVLDGTSVYARSIHMLSGSPEGECKGRVLGYNPGSRELSVISGLSRKPLILLVPMDASFERQGQTSFSSRPSGLSDLVSGSLISVRFNSNKEGRGVASHIAILAVPGAAFMFGGNLSSVDKHTGVLVLVNPESDERYEVICDSHCLNSNKEIHAGDNITVSATFDGSRYTASEIAVN